MPVIASCTQELASDLILSGHEFQPDDILKRISNWISEELRLLLVLYQTVRNYKDKYNEWINPHRSGE